MLALRPDHRDPFAGERRIAPLDYFRTIFMVAPLHGRCGAYVVDAGRYRAAAIIPAVPPATREPPHPAAARIEDIPQRVTRAPRAAAPRLRSGSGRRGGPRGDIDLRDIGAWRAGGPHDHALRSIGSERGEDRVGKQCAAAASRFGPEDGRARLRQLASAATTKPVGSSTLPSASTRTP